MVLIRQERKKQEYQKSYVVLLSSEIENTPNYVCSQSQAVYLSDDQIPRKTKKITQEKKKRLLRGMEEPRPSRFK